MILHNLLRGDHGIRRRHFASPDIARIFDLSPDELNLAFRTEAPRLAGAVLTRALAQCGVRPEELDALFICTCTGYLCPGVTSYVAEQLGLRPDAFLQDLAGLGCGAAIPTLRSASHFLAAHPDATVACVAVEICSAAFYLDDDPGVLISACLFSDGAAATVWRGAPGPSRLRAHGFDTVHRPQDRDKLRFEMRTGKLRNLLDRTVPELAAGAVAALWKGGEWPVSRVVTHSGGVDVLDALAPRLPDYSLEASRTVLREYGNMNPPRCSLPWRRPWLRPARPGGRLLAREFWGRFFGPQLPAGTNLNLRPAGTRLPFPGAGGVSQRLEFTPGPDPGSLFPSELRLCPTLSIHPAARGHTLLTVAVAIAGAIAFVVLPVAPLPQVDFPTISVSAGLPGASAQIMAASVATPLERQFSHIAGITEMTSSSSPGSTTPALIEQPAFASHERDAPNSAVHGNLIRDPTNGDTLLNLIVVPSDKVKLDAPPFAAVSALEAVVKSVLVYQIPNRAHRQTPSC